MHLLYWLGIRLYVAAIWLAALSSTKAKALVKGRRRSWRYIRHYQVPTHQPRLWVHASSVGEFEQARPLIDRLKEEHPRVHITVTFFSPSGYELRHGYAAADQVLYLPADTHRRMKTYYDRLQPTAVVVVKYDYWWHLFRQANSRGIPLFLISALFRPSQPFFVWWGTMFRSLLRSVDHIYVQDATSQELLAERNISSELAGDSRFDQVLKIKAKVKTIEIIETFAQDKKLMVVGSSWPEDLRLLAVALSQLPDDWKVVVAPHQVDPTSIATTLELLPADAQLYSSYSPDSPCRYLVIDNVGMLSSIYSYGQLAYVGGGLKTGLHNTLEPAVFGLPVLFGGPRPLKFIEALALLDMGAAANFVASDKLFQKLRHLWADPAECERMGQLAATYVETAAGATDKFYPTVIKALGI